METLGINVEKSTIYPSVDTMELFLNIGKKLNIFEEKFSEKNNVNMYSNVSVVHALAIFVEKIQTKGNEKLKAEFQSILETDDTDKIYRFIANAVLDAWLEKHDNEFVRQTVKADKQKFEKITNFSRDDISPIPYSYLPTRYGEPSSANLIHKNFETELAKLNRILKGADEIQQKTASHSFKRGDNSKELNDLKRKL